MNQSSIFQSSSSVLVIKLRGIGDVLLSTPLIENLKKQFPHLQIDYLCEEFACDVLRGNPWLDNVIPFNKRKESGFDLVKKIRQKKYDIIIDLYGNPRAAIITLLSSAQHRIGFPFRARKYAYNFLVPPRGGEVHNVDFNLDVLRYFQIPIVSSQPYFPVDETNKKFAIDWLSHENLLNKSIVGIIPSSGWYTREWDLKSFAALADQIIEKKYFSMVLIWGPGEQGKASIVQKMMRNEIHLFPTTTLKQMGALLAHCTYIVSNNNGPMHIAASLGVPILEISGPTNPKLQGPFGQNHLTVRNEKLDCLECNLTECPIGHVCMKDLSVDVVFNAFQQLVQKNSK